MYSFVGGRSTTAETTAAAVAHLGVTTYMFFIIFVHVTFLRVVVVKKTYQAVRFPYNRMLKLSSSRGIRIDVPVLSVSWSAVDHTVIIQALKKRLNEREASDTGGVSRWKCSGQDRLADATS